MIAGLLLRGALSAIPQQRTPPPKPPSGPNWGPVIFVLLAPVMWAILQQGYYGRVSFVTTSIYIVAFIALIPVVGLLQHLANRSRKRGVVRGYERRQAQQAAAPRPSQEWRSQARRLRAAQAAREAALGPAERHRRVMDLFSVDCPVESCGAAVGTPCAMGSGIPVSMVEPYVFCHHARMRDAVRYGVADPDDILAQFDNNVTEGTVWALQRKTTAGGSGPA